MQLNNTTNPYVDCVCPVSDVRAVFEVDAMKIGLKLVLFSLSVCFSFSPHWHLCLKKGSVEASGACVLT